MSLLEKYFQLFRTSVINPRLISEYFGIHRRATREPRYRKRVSEYGNLLVNLEKGIEVVLAKDSNTIFKEEDAVTISEVWEYIRLRISQLPTDSPWAKGIADRGLLETYYRICRVLMPEVVVETGVAFGSSTLFLLTALDKNNKGRLFSIDLPLLANRNSQFIGSLVPEERQGRWELTLNSSNRALPQLLKELGGIDIFIHDSDHSYENMMFEFKTAWPYLRSKGILLSDDVDQNDAFLDYSDSVKRHPVIIKSLERDKMFGIIAK